MFLLTAANLPAAEPLKGLLITGGCCHDYAGQKDLLEQGIEARAHVDGLELLPADIRRQHFPVGLNGRVAGDSRALPGLADDPTVEPQVKQTGHKVYHGGAGGPQRRLQEFDVWGPAGGIGVKPEQKLIPPTPGGNHPLMDWGVFPHRDEDKGDYHVADWTIQQIREMPEDQPFFLAAGFFLPHVPCYATQKWFDLYPEESLILPPVLAHDRDDTPDSPGTCTGSYPSLVWPGSKPTTSGARWWASAACCPGSVSANGATIGSGSQVPG
jgi:hypothetical protein